MTEQRVYYDLEDDLLWQRDHSPWSWLGYTIPSSGGREADDTMAREAADIWRREDRRELIGGH